MSLEIPQIGKMYVSTWDMVIHICCPNGIVKRQRLSKDTPIVLLEATRAIPSMPLDLSEHPEGRSYNTYSMKFLLPTGEVGYITDWIKFFEVVSK